MTKAEQAVERWRRLDGPSKRAVLRRMGKEHRGLKFAGQPAAAYDMKIAIDALRAIKRPR